MNNKFLKLVAILILMVPGLASGTPISFVLSGVMPDYGAAEDPFKGEAFSAILTIDDVPLTGFSDGTYESSGAPFGMLFSIAGVVGVADRVFISISDNSYYFPYGGGYYDMVFIRASGPEFNFLMWFADPDLTTFSGVDLLPDLSKFSRQCFGLASGCELRIGDLIALGGFLGVDNMTSARLPFFVPIPEPSAIALLGIGLFGLGLSRRRKGRLSS